MFDFDADPESDDYPEKLREVRKQMGWTQGRFAEAAGYSAIMQGRYETDRSKKNSAKPSPKTARAIKKMIETEQGAHGADAPVPAPVSGETPSGVRRSLKSVSVYEIEQAVSSAIGTLIGAQCQVTVKDMVWSGDSASDAAISLCVATQA